MVESLQSRVIATIIRETFDDFHHEFHGVTERAPSRFERREWLDAQADAVERLALYRDHVGRAADRLAAELGGSAARRDIWLGAKSAYAKWVAARDDFEIAETFFNSVTRRVFTTIGVDDNLEFVWFGASSLPRGTDNHALFEVHHAPAATVDMVRSILSAYSFRVPYAHLERDSTLIAERLDERLSEVWDTPTLDTIDMLRPIFYRNKGAYLIGRVRARNRVIPFIIPLLNTPDGIVVDTVLLSEGAASRIFSFTRSYFHVGWSNPAEIVGFLKSLLPMKPIAELFNSIGYPSHGKTMLYRALYRHLENSTDKFEPARGVKGTVMTVFTLPSYDVVFKIIKDRFAPPKTITRAQVREKYRLVALHDRVGRMVDAQEFENLSFDRARFSGELLAELIADAAASVRVTDRRVIISHLYAERRLYPLDLYLLEVRDERAHNAVLEYGRAVKDLAAADIFPGGLFTKNFGVTRHGSVVFYDYDEICLLSQCRFRAIPEHFHKFMYLPDALREVFLAEHADLLTAAFWQGVQDRNAEGDLIDFFPYPQQLRFAQ